MSTTRQYSLMRKPGGARRGIRRRVRYLGLRGDVYCFACYSRSRPGALEHHQYISAATLRTTCTCEDYLCRHYKHEPTTNDDSHHCDHIRRAVEWLQRHELLPAPGCVVCGVMDAAQYHKVADENGEPTGGMICSDCIKNRNERQL